MIAVKVNDEDMGGKCVKSFTIADLDEELTLREILEARVYQEVRDYQQNQEEVFMGMLEVTDYEKALNGEKKASAQAAKVYDWKEQVEKVCTAFERNAFFVFVDGLQMRELDQKVELRADSQVKFIQMIPLIGG